VRIRFVARLLRQSVRHAGVRRRDITGLTRPFGGVLGACLVMLKASRGHRRVLEALAGVR
jgi:hypothetical protein